MIFLLSFIKTFLILFEVLIPISLFASIPLMPSLPSSNEINKVIKSPSNDDSLILLDNKSNLSSVYRSNEPTEAESYFYLNDLPNKRHPNKIVSSRYTFMNFLPTNTFHQLSKPSTCFFTVTLILLCIPSISPFEPYSYALAFVIVVGTSMIKDAMEDFKRHKEDAKINTEKCYRVDRESIINSTENNLIKSKIDVQNVKTGDFLILESGDLVPADVILLRAFFRKGEEIYCSNHCFVETSNLDGENNLKKKNCLEPRIIHAFNLKKHKRENEIYASEYGDLCDCSKHFLEKIKKFRTKNTGETFNDFFCKVVLQSRSDLTGSNILTADAKNVLLKGSVIKNTPLILCLAVSVGKNTKMAKSISTHRKNKSIFEKKTENVLIIIFGIYALMLISTMLFGIIYNAKNSDLTAGTIVKMFFTNYILYTYLVPLSLFVTIEITRIFHSQYISFDKEMCVENNPESQENSDNNQTNRDRADFLQAPDFQNTNSNEINEETIQDEKSDENDENRIEIIPVDEEFDAKHQINERSRWNSLKCPENEPENNNAVFSRCRNSNVIEDLGYIDYVLTDKTGTLTKNSMKLRKFHFKLRKSDRDVSMSVQKFFDQLIPKKYKGISKTDIIDLSKDSVLFILNILICNSVEILENNYEGISQEEISMLKNLEKFNFKLIEREESYVTISFAGIKKKIEILHFLDFTSSRQRQSVIAKIEGKIILFTKGSDQRLLCDRITVIKESCGTVENYESIKKTAECFQESDFLCKISNGQINMSLLKNEKYKSSKEFLINVSKYRAFAFCYKTLTDVQYNAFVETKKILMSNTDTFNKSIDVLYSVMEFNSQFLGSTLIEDALQEKVKETILELQLNKIKVWMITGDKKETAVSCGKDAGMITERFIAIEGKDAVRILEEHVRLRVARKLNIKEIVMRFLDVLQKSIFFHNRVENAERINSTRSELATDYSLLHFPSVIIFRATPAQKGKIVFFLNKLKINTLAIGDGNNDVAMLKESHVGVGIIGKEGNQAVLNADFAVPSFRQLRKLILWHGKFNLIRFSKMTINSFYKNLYFILIQFYYNFYNAGSGFPIYNVTFLNYFNTFYTALIPIAVALFDRTKPNGFDFQKSRFYYSKNQVYLHIVYAVTASFTCFLFFKIFLYNQIVTGPSGHLISFSGESVLISFVVFITVIIRQYRLVAFSNIFAYLAIICSILCAGLLQWISSQITFIYSSTTAFECGLHVFKVPLLYFIIVACVSTLYVLDTAFEAITQNMVEVEYRGRK
ncbi:P-type ATPase [Nucleospora cyclopteri]